MVCIVLSNFLSGARVVSAVWIGLKTLAPWIPVRLSKRYRGYLPSLWMLRGRLIAPQNPEMFKWLRRTGISPKAGAAQRRTFCQSIRQGDGLLFARSAPGPNGSGERRDQVLSGQRTGICVCLVCSVKCVVCCLFGVLFVACCLVCVCVVFCSMFVCCFQTGWTLLS